MTHGTVDATPWARAAVGDVAAMRTLRRRVPVDHTLHLSARTAHGPWHVAITRKGRTLVDFKDCVDMSAAIEKALSAAAAEPLWLQA